MASQDNPVSYSCFEIHSLSLTLERSTPVGSGRDPILCHRKDLHPTATTRFRYPPTLLSGKTIQLIGGQPEVFHNPNTYYTDASRHSPGFASASSQQSGGYSSGSYVGTNTGPTFDPAVTAGSHTTPVQSGAHNQDQDLIGQEWMIMTQQISANVQEQMAETLRVINQRIQELEELKRTEQADSKVKKGRCPQPITRLVKRTMLDLLGMDDPKGPVPGPLGPGEPPRVNASGTELHNPSWEGNADGTQPLVVATVAVIWANETTSRTLPEKLGALDADLKALIKSATIQHWSSKKKTYSGQTTESGSRKILKKRIYNRTYARYSRKVARRRNQVPAFKTKFGAENCVGLEGLLHTPWVSDDGSEPENADPVRWNTRRMSTGDKRACEHLHPDWRSAQLDRIYATLDTLDRRHKPASNLFVSGPSRSRGSAKIERFRGFPENSLKGQPRGSRVPYLSCVNAVWAEKEGYECVEDPADFTIFDLAISDADIDEEDLALLADDES
ncbi:hypothetical protein B0H16DRAFT_1684117 [Mycena metata]|uniref:Uncharacterized protein n=1 Tax=Mycena metata TaxID=1033252 RepID=A0AAD7K126_9AGAR|nr:hypothetical protein B0H16DRAFT_1684117 [Mycena metata]